MKLRKLEVYVIDHDNLTEAELVSVFENVEELIGSRVAVKTAELGEWSDDHELNQLATPLVEFRRYFE